MSKTEHDALVAAADAALKAPSIFNTQPWLWRVDANSLELSADRDRLLVTTDPEGRLLVLSCGVALHHARVALAAAGWEVVVDRLPQPDDPDVLARVRLVQPAPAVSEAEHLNRAIFVRRTDRRPFGDQPVSEEDVARLVDAARGQGVGVHEVRLDQMPMLAVAVASAQTAQKDSSDHRNELMRWTNRPQWSNDGVPQATGVAHVARRVPVRDFVLPPNDGMSVEPGGDRGARYLVVYTDSDETIDRLLAGEGASAVMLTAVSLGLGVAPISDVVEVARPRDLVRGLLPGRGHPHLVIRCGYPVDTRPIQPAPRRTATDAVQGPRP